MTPRWEGIFSQDNLPLRDIDKKLTYTEFGMKVLSGPGDIQMGNYHANSLFFSHILWEVRKLLGAEETFQMLKPFVDNLHLYRASFEHWYPEWSGFIKGDLLYFLAVLNKTANKVEVDHVIAKVAREWGFGLGEIKNISRHIKKTGEITGLDLEAEQKLGTDLAVKTTKSLVFRNGGAIIVFLGSWKFGHWVYEKLTSQAPERASE